MQLPIVEIFESIQGEGINVGEMEVFVRVSGCNLNCKYCDTTHNTSNYFLDYNGLYEKLKAYNSDVISLTGGEPLLYADFFREFFVEYKNKLNKKFYLETNGTLYNELDKIVDFIDSIGMDIKLESATGEENKFKENEEFLKSAQKSNVFVKVVFDKNIKDYEIKEAANLVKKFDVPLILQPKMPIDKGLALFSIYNKFYQITKNTRLIGQTHKFLNIK